RANLQLAKCKRYTSRRWQLKDKFVARFSLQLRYIAMFSHALTIVVNELEDHLTTSSSGNPEPGGQITATISRMTCRDGTGRSLAWDRTVSNRSTRTYEEQYGQSSVSARLGRASDRRFPGCPF